jgi:paraquat-inducible protein B
MNEPTPPGVEELPEALPSPSRFGRIPLVWLLPIVVVVAGAFVVIHEKLSEGMAIEISFHNAEGLEANKTKIRYKEVDIGEVTDISVSKDRKEVIVRAQINRNAKDYMVNDTRFWVVRPRVSAAGITGLGTLVSGEYISADVGTSETRSSSFVGLEAPPIITSNQPGRSFVLHADDLGSLSIGSQVFFRHVEAGQVIGYTLDPGGNGVTIKIFVNAPFDGYVNAGTRFWQASGVDMAVTSDGVRLHTESLTAILEGGVAFQSLPGAAATPVPDDTAYTLYGDQDRAMRPIESEIRSFMMFFRGSLRGLSAGAPVELNGINIGEVKSVDVEFDESSGSLRFPVVAELYPQRIRGKAARTVQKEVVSGEQASRRLLNSLVQHGLRAELKTGNLLTGQKLVVLDMHADAPPDRVDWEEKPPIFPTISGSLDEIQDSVGSIARSLSKVHFDELSYRLASALTSLDQTLKSADKVLNNVDNNLAPQIQATLAEAQAAMKSANQILGEDAPLQGELGDALLQVSRAAKSVNALVDYLQRHPESLLRGKPGDAP